MLRNSIRTTGNDSEGSEGKVKPILPAGPGAWFNARVNGSQPLVRVRRGGHEESLHRGSLVLVEGERLLGYVGDPERLTFYRSSSKPLQAIASVVAGTADAFRLT